LRISVIIALFISLVSWGHPGDTIVTNKNEKLTSYIPKSYSQDEKIDSLKKFLKFAPDLVFSATSKNPFYQTGLNINTGFQRVVKSGVRYSGEINLRSGLTTQGSIPYFSDPQTKSFVLSPIKDSVYEQPTNYYFDANGFLALNYKNISLDAGMGNPDIWYGIRNRNIFNSTYGISNPYARLNIKFSKSFSYSLRQDILREKMGNHFEPKGNVTHSLTYNHKGEYKFQARLFETVVYQMKDTLYNRGFEVEYLNPFLFFRPQEYNMGSADNILLGAEFNYRFKLKFKGKKYLYIPQKEVEISKLKGGLASDKAPPNFVYENVLISRIYGQILIDDFLLSAFRARNGWWGNKYGFNIGYRLDVYTYDSTNSITVAKTYSMEFTFMRPYVFSQTNPGIVYGNQGLPIAHPLGSNFAELYQDFWWTPHKKKISFDAFLQAYIKGVDSVGLKNSSFGGDIYRSYSKHPYEFNNKVGQGITLRTIQLGTRLSYKTNFDLKYLEHLFFYIEPRYRLMFFENHRQEDFFLTIGIQSNIWRNRDRLNY
jgi:hypothetical protein